MWLPADKMNDNLGNEYFKSSIIQKLHFSISKQQVQGCIYEQFVWAPDTSVYEQVDWIINSWFVL